jgi:protein-tyrosine phosphatase
MIVKVTNVLFICSGNIFRSRYAEAYLNFIADSRRLPIIAESRGLTVDKVDLETSPYVIDRLEVKAIPAKHMGAGKSALSEEDLSRADLVIALRDREHRPMLSERFPAWADRVTYWDVEDLDEDTTVDTIFSKIEDLVSNLLKALE